MDDIEIHPLGPDRLEDYLWFMENEAFSGNPDWRGCYCVEGHRPVEDGEVSQTEAPGARRAEITDLIVRGGHHGLLAYRDGGVVGWTHATPMIHLQNQEYRLGRSDDELAELGAIVCFNLAGSVRRLGLPGVLLREALRRFADQGLRAAEAFPWKEPSPRPGRNYLGTVQLYEVHGFRRARETEDAVVMRRELKG